MATVKVYRAAYTYGTAEDASIHFSDWISLDGLDEVEARLAAVNPSMNGGMPGVEPTILGWEEKKLDTEPV